MPKPLDPNGLAGAFAAGPKTSLDFLIPPRAEPAPAPAPETAPEAEAPAKKATRKKATKKKATRKKATRKKATAKKAPKKKAPKQKATKKKATKKTVRRKEVAQAEPAGASSPEAVQPEPTTVTVNETPTVRVTRAEVADAVAEVEAVAIPTAFVPRCGWTPGTPAGDPPRRWRLARTVERWIGRLVCVVLLPGPVPGGV